MRTNEFGEIDETAFDDAESSSYLGGSATAEDYYEAYDDGDYGFDDYYEGDYDA